MRRFIFLIFSLILFANIGNKAYSQNQQYVQMGAKIVKIGDKKILAISFENEKLWHTYWKNPGDAGLEISVDFSSLEEKIYLKDYPWPAPKRYIEAGEMWAYGYSGKYALYYDIDSSLANKTLKIDGKWLVCKDICIPGSASVNLKIDSNLNGESNSRLTSSELIESFENLPKNTTTHPVQLYLNFNKEKNKLALHYLIENADLSLVDSHKNVITPYLTKPLDYKHEEAYFDEATKTLFGRIYIDWDGIYEEPTWDLPTDGVFKKPLKVKYLLNYPKNSPAKIITHQFINFNFEGDNALSESFKKATPLLGFDQGVKKTEDQNNIFYYLLFAFLGGIILNLMPCVLPVISLKLFALISHNEESKKNILKHNLAYSFGVLASFLALAGAVYLLKTSGEKIGWGFQLQSPPFVFIMLFLVFIMSLNMLGLFEFRTPGGKIFGGLRVENSFIGDFINGVLATILSTPCSAPFLGTALTFAFTTSSANIFLIFSFVGLGLSFPFLLTGFFPALIKFLPRPGMWMEKLKYFLGATLLLTSVWLLDVLYSLIDSETFSIYINTILSLVFFAFFFRKHISQSKIWNVLFFIIPIILVANIASSGAFNVYDKGYKNSESSWQPWSIENMDEVKKKGHYAFINFTANWCLTCKVNKKLVLETDAFKEFVSKNNIILLEGDWTKRDDKITNFLNKYKIVGVPAYFIQTPEGEVISLGETISLAKIKKFIQPD